MVKGIKVESQDFGLYAFNTGVIVVVATLSYLGGSWIAVTWFYLGIASWPILFWNRKLWPQKPGFTVYFTCLVWGFGGIFVALKKPKPAAQEPEEPEAVPEPDQATTPTSS